MVTPCGEPLPTNPEKMEARLRTTDPMTPVLAFEAFPGFWISLDFDALTLVGVSLGDDLRNTSWKE
jgi:hypothetical protein